MHFALVRRFRILIKYCFAPREYVNNMSTAPSSMVGVSGCYSYQDAKTVEMLQSAFDSVHISQQLDDDVELAANTTTGEENA